MNDDTIADLKQFIASVVRQEVSGAVKSEVDTLRQKIDGLRHDLAGVESRLTAKIDGLQTSVSQALDTSNDAIDDQIEDHEVRMHGRLKHKAA